MIHNALEIQIMKRMRDLRGRSPRRSNGLQRLSGRRLGSGRCMTIAKCTGMGQLSFPSADLNAKTKLIPLSSRSGIFDNRDLDVSLRRREGQDIRAWASAIADELINKCSGRKDSYKCSLRAPDFDRLFA